MGNLLGELHRALKRSPYRVCLGPFDIRLPGSNGYANERTNTVVQPDIFVVRDPTKLDELGCVGAPDLIIEVVSPKSLVRDTRTKFDLYAAQGIAEYWIVYANEQVITAFIRDASGAFDLMGIYFEPGAMPVHTLPGLNIE
ncbi:Uma2 family endonuclease [uncultured Hymenobacter sp.]|uniref:Uma2 family endonuclease n=1 Tax=uncultured Hymenobacter sp. TaxID=170016 RepID=UPI0035CA8AE7